MCLQCFDNLRRSPRSDSPRHTQSHNMGIDLVILVISRWGERAGRGNSVILCSRGRLAQRLAQVLYTHKAGGSNPSSPTIELLGLQRWRPFFFVPGAWDSNPQGCGAEETRSVFQRSTRGAERRSGARAAPAARGHPSSPTTELETVLARGPFFVWAQRMGFEP